MGGETSNTVEPLGTSFTRGIIDFPMPANNNGNDDPVVAARTKALEEETTIAYR
jgi:hypothetical protein